MPQIFKQISLIYYVLLALLLVGVVPLVLTGWFLSERSAKELRAVEGRYQTQLVQDKARQIELFGQKYSDLVKGIAKSFELSPDLALLSSSTAQQQFSQTLKDNPNLLALYIKPVIGEPLSVYRTERISEEQIQSFSFNMLSRLNEKRVLIERPESGNSFTENAFVIAAPVFEKDKLSAAVVAIVSLSEISTSGRTFEPSWSTTTPSTLTQPFSMQVSASRREQMPRSAINFERRSGAFGGAESVISISLPERDFLVMIFVTLAKEIHAFTDRHILNGPRQ